MLGPYFPLAVIVPFILSEISFENTIIDIELDPSGLTATLESLHQLLQYSPTRLPLVSLSLVKKGIWPHEIKPLPWLSRTVLGRGEEGLGRLR